jgi:hypothetical protein
MPGARDGVVVPLQVALRTRLKAGLGLVLLVGFLGAAVALVLAAVALAAIAALAQF